MDGQTFKKDSRAGTLEVSCSNKQLWYPLRKKKNKNSTLRSYLSNITGGSFGN